MPFGVLEALLPPEPSTLLTYLGKLKTYQNKPCAIPAIAAQWKAFSDAGCWNLTPSK
jgi:hypothetical protein